MAEIVEDKSELSRIICGRKASRRLYPANDTDPWIGIFTDVQKFSRCELFWQHRVDGKPRWRHHAISGVGRSTVASMIRPVTPRLI